MTIIDKRALVVDFKIHVYNEKYQPVSALLVKHCCKNYLVTFLHRNFMINGAQEVGFLLLQRQISLSAKGPFANYGHIYRIIYYFYYYYYY